MDNRELVFSAKLPRDFEKRQNEIPNKNTIGFESEMRKYPKYKRLREINSFATNTFKETRESNYYYEATMILGRLNLSLKLRTDIIERAKVFYTYFEKYSNSRGANVLIPVATYIIILERFIFSKRKGFYVFCSKHEFDRCLKIILTNNEKLRFKFRSDEFRKKTINVQLNGLKEHFYLNGAFFIVMSENLNKHFENLRQFKNTTIAGAIFDLTSKQLTKSSIIMTVVCRFLGIVPSTIFRRRLY